MVRRFLFREEDAPRALEPESALRQECGFRPSANVGNAWESFYWKDDLASPAR